MPTPGKANKLSSRLHKPASVSKKYLHSSSPSSLRSVQCTAFRTESVPNNARRDCGRNTLASDGLGGPANSRNEDTTWSLPSLVTSAARTGVRHMCSIKAV